MPLQDTDPTPSLGGFGLKGSGPNKVAAIWASGPTCDTQQGAEAVFTWIAAERDTRWDDSEAIIFLQHSQTYLPSTQQAERFYLSSEHYLGGDSYFGIYADDYYSITSQGNKLWLPAEAPLGTQSQPGGDQKRFLMDAPPATGPAPTITLGELKARIAAVTAKLRDGDGTEEYRECVKRTYMYERRNRHKVEMGSEGYFYRIPDQELESGLASSTVVYEDSEFGILPDRRGRVWFDGTDASLFSVEFGDDVPFDLSGDGTIDSIHYARLVVTSRPIPEGVYSFHFNNVWAIFTLCDGYTIRYEWTVTVIAPESVLHEAFFDPVTVGSALAVDSANGVLKPATFTDTNGASATIERIAWETGTVSIELSPHTGVAGHAVDFIALDASVSLSLDVADATVDAASDTLSWPEASRPWRSGDKLMLRIREASR